VSLIDVDPTREGSVHRALAAVAGRAGDVLRIAPGPNGDGYPLLDWVVSPLPETCDRENLGLAIDYRGAAIPWDDVVRFARAYPSLPIVVMGAAVGKDRVVPAVLDVAPNLVFEIAPTLDGDALARLVDRVGAHRFTERADAIEAGAWREAHL
jgi:hypothetical protein